MKNNFVIYSVNNFDETKCIDLFQRKDKSFGYQEYRRDKETYEGWYKVASYEDMIFLTKEEAYNSACKNIGWLRSEKK